MFLRKDPCGLICIVLTYGMLFHCFYFLIFELIIPFLSQSIGGIINGFVLSTLIVLSIVSHGRAAFFDPGFVPLPKRSLDFSDMKIDEMNRSQNGESWTVCNRCDTYRPARSHHCRICRRCVRRLDHHCPWINNCVGEFNQKYFLLFLFYIGVTSLYVLTLIIWFLLVFSIYSNRLLIQSIVVGIEASLFGIFVVSLLFDQIQSIITDRTLIDRLKNIEPTRHRTSKMILFRRIFGSGSMICWFNPCQSNNSIQSIDFQPTHQI